MLMSLFITLKNHLLLKLTLELFKKKKEVLHHIYNGLGKYLNMTFIIYYFVTKYFHKINKKDKYLFR